MLLDWNHPLELDAPRRRQVRAQFSDRLKLARAKAKRVKGPKNHSTNKERSFEDRTRHMKLVKVMKAAHEKREAYNDQVRAYWLGERPDHPVL